MYQINNRKRYTVEVRQPNGQNLLKIFKNAKLIAAEPGFVAIKDEAGKDHIFTGEIGIYISES